MDISFERRDGELILKYEPDFGVGDILKRLKNKEKLWIKRTFKVRRELLRAGGKNEFEDCLCFKIGTVDEGYSCIDSEVIETVHKFFFSNDIKLTNKMFVAYQNISILRKIDDVIERDLYIGGDWEKLGGISAEVFQQLVRIFPKTTELKRYTEYRIANCIKEFLPECDKFKGIYEKHIEKKRNTLKPIQLDTNIEIEAAQFKTVRDELTEMLNCAYGYGEKAWQDKIHKVLRLLYPQYILFTREIVFKGCDGYDKQPDYLMVDANGFVDVLEIKKPDVQLLTKQASYRNNYVPVREFSGAIQQIEKYIYCLNSVDGNKEVIKKKLAGLLPNSVTIEILNPKGILLAGRSKEFNEQEMRDFELIKRQYKNIADIMTYDDLLMRVNNIAAALEQNKRMGSE